MLTGRENWKKQLLEDFPNEKQAIEKYFNLGTIHKLRHFLRGWVHKMLTWEVTDGWRLSVHLKTLNLGLKLETK